MRCIVYVSTATSEMSDEDLEFILRESVRRNREGDITGVLLHNGGNFMQCIEGPEAAMAETFARIKSSRLHYGVIELMNDPVDVRSFGAWHMGNAGVSRSSMLALMTADWQRVQAELGNAQTPPVGFKLLTQFWQNLSSSW
jgi:hypothetical protein